MDNILREVLKKSERRGVEVVMCPKCSKTIVRDVIIDAANAWAFKDGMTVMADGRATGCGCFKAN